MYQLPNSNQPKPNQQPNPQGQQGQPNGQPAPNGQPNPNDLDPVTGLPKTQGQPNGTDQNPANPLDFFKGMYDNKPNAASEPPKFAIPTENLQKAAGSIDFMQGIDPELMNKAKTGDVTSIMTMMGEVARNAYSNSMNHMSTLSDNFINQRLGFENTALPNKVKEQLTNHELGSNNAAFSHPVVKAQLTEVAKRLAGQYPDASPSEIAAQAKSYIIEMAKQLNGNGQDSTTGGNAGGDQGSAKEINWDDYFK